MQFNGLVLKYWYFTKSPSLVFPSTSHCHMRKNPAAEPAALILLILHYWDTAGKKWPRRAPRDALASRTIPYGIEAWQSCSARPRAIMAACSRKQSSFPASGTSRDWNDSQKMKRFLPASRVNCMQRRLQACFLTWQFSRKGICSNDFSFLPLQFKLTQKKKRENQFSFLLSCLFRHLGFIYTRKNSEGPGWSTGMWLLALSLA